MPRPWDSPGKNTGVGCHFLLQCMKVKSESQAAQSCPTLHNPMDCSLPGSSVHGIFQARVLEWGAIAFSDHTILYQFSRWENQVLRRNISNVIHLVSGRATTKARFSDFKIYASNCGSPPYSFPECRNDCNTAFLSYISLTINSITDLSNWPCSQCRGV